MIEETLQKTRELLDALKKQGPQPSDAVLSAMGELIPLVEHVVTVEERAKKWFDPNRAGYKRLVKDFQAIQDERDELWRKALTNAGSGWDTPWCPMFINVVTEEFNRICSNQKKVS